MTRAPAFGLLWIVLAGSYLAASALGHRAFALAVIGLMAGALFAAGGRWLLGALLGVVLAALAFRFSEHAALFAYLPPLAAFAFMALFFGRTLAAGRVPFIVRIARMEHPQLPPAMERHARALTALWTACFVALFAAALGLAFAVPFAAWAWWVQGLGYVVPGLLFVGELIYRKRVFAEHSHGSLAELVRITMLAIREDARGAPRPADATRA